MPVAIVTGAAQGIGQAVCQRLLEKGFKVGLLDINEDVGREAARHFAHTFGEGHVRFRRCDVTDRAQLIAAFEQVPRQLGDTLAVVVNNAGIMNEARWEQMIDINLSAVIRGTYIALNLMSKANNGKGGLIINTASRLAVKPFCYSVYGATKGAIFNFTLSFREIPGFLEKHGVRINCVCPGLTETPISASSVTLDRNIPIGLDDSPDLEAQVKLRAAFCLSAQSMTPREISHIFMYFVDNECENGRALYLDDADGALKYYKPVLPGLSDSVDIDEIVGQDNTIDEMKAEIEAKYHSTQTPN